MRSSIIYCPRTARGLRLALYALVVSVAVIALLTFPAGATLRNPETRAIIGSSRFMNSLIVLIMLVFLARLNRLDSGSGARRSFLPNQRNV